MPVTLAQRAAVIDAQSTKPDEKFLIVVLLCIFIILGLSLVFLIRPYVVNAVRRLRNQQTAVEFMVHKKKKRRKPRIYTVWIDWAATWTANDGRRLPTAETRHWEALQPLAMSIRHSPDPAGTHHNTSIDSTPALDPCKKNDSWPRCRVEALHSPMDPLPSPDELHDADPTPIPTVSTAQICTLVSMPCSSRPTYIPSIPTFHPSLCNDPQSSSSPPSAYPSRRTSSIDWTYSPASCPEHRGKGAVPPMPSGLTLGVAYYTV